MIRLFHTKIGFYRIYPSGFYVDPIFPYHSSWNPDTSSAGSCNKFRKFLQQVPIHALTIPVEVVPARTPAHALKELVLFEKHKFH